MTCLCELVCAVRAIAIVLFTFVFFVLYHIEYVGAPGWSNISRESFDSTHKWIRIPLLFLRLNSCQANSLHGKIDSGVWSFCRIFKSFKFDIEISTKSLSFILCGDMVKIWIWIEKNLHFFDLFNVQNYDYRLTCKLESIPICVMGQWTVVTLINSRRNKLRLHTWMISSNKWFASKRSSTKSVNFKYFRCINFECSFLSDFISWPEIKSGNQIFQLPSVDISYLRYRII